MGKEGDRIFLVRVILLASNILIEKSFRVLLIISLSLIKERDYRVSSFIVIIINGKRKERR